MKATEASVEVEHCERCHEPLAAERIVWLELNCKTGQWAVPGSAPWSGSETDSQGCFPFGQACSQRVLSKQSLTRR